MRLSPVFIYENDTLFSAINAMDRFSIDKISIIKEDFSIVGYIDSKKAKEIVDRKFQGDIGLTKVKIKDVMIRNNFPIVLYPKMKITNAYSAMKCLNIKCLPVVDAPWDKKIVGFLWLDDISPIVEKTFINIPV
jgi:predicted transcriptional regulator